MTDLMDLHTHTVASGHAYNTIYEMARSACEKGLKLLGIADHGPAMPGSSDAIYFSNFKMLPRELYGVKMMFGCELNIMDHDGTVDLPEHILEKLDYAVASIHGIGYPAGTVSQNTRAYLKALENPYVQIIGHPDDSGFPADYETLVHAAREHHKLLEVNSTSLGPKSVRSGGRENYLVMLDWCKRLGQPIIIDSDAHCEVDVGNHARAIQLLEEVGFPEALIVNRSLDAAAEYLPFLKKLPAGG